MTTAIWFEVESLKALSLFSSLFAWLFDNKPEKSFTRRGGSDFGGISKPFALKENANNNITDKNSKVRLATIKTRNITIVSKK